MLISLGYSHCAGLLCGRTLKAQIGAGSGESPVGEGEQRLAAWRIRRPQLDFGDGLGTEIEPVDAHRPSRRSVIAFDECVADIDTDSELNGVTIIVGTRPPLPLSFDGTTDR